MWWVKAGSRSARNLLIHVLSVFTHASTNNKLFNVFPKIRLIQRPFLGQAAQHVGQHQVLDEQVVLRLAGIGHGGCDRSHIGNENAQTALGWCDARALFLGCGWLIHENLFLVFTSW